MRHARLTARCPSRGLGSGVALALLAFAAGCLPMRHGRVRGPDPFAALATIVVADAIVDAATTPPPPPPPPRPRVVWVDGHSVWAGDHWVWQPGGWQPVGR